jgi:hypothetical protein
MSDSLIACYILFTFQPLVVELVDAIVNARVVGDVDEPVSMYTNPENKTCINFDYEE